MEEILYQNYLEFNIYIIILNVLLFLSAKKIFSILNFREKSLNLFLFKLVNVGFIVLTLLDKVFDQNTLLFFDIISTLLIIYVAILTQEFFVFYILKKLGNKEVINEKSNYKENHSTRIMTILSFILITIISLIILIKTWDFDSALETTGVLGIFFGFLAFTSSIWGPDLISGILLLNNNLVNDGDLIKLKEERYIVFKFGFFETVLLNVNSNGRVILKNSLLRDSILEVLNKNASVAGLREEVIYDIPYNNKEDYEKYFEELETVRKNICEKMKLFDSKVNENREIEFRILDNGKYAIKIAFYYYLKNLKSIKSTTLARDFFSLKSEFHKIALVEFQKKGIYLDTPDIVSYLKK